MRQERHGGVRRKGWERYCSKERVPYPSRRVYREPGRPYRDVAGEVEWDFSILTSASSDDETSIKLYVTPTTAPQDSVLYFRTTTRVPLSYCNDSYSSPFLFPLYYDDLGPCSPVSGSLCLKDHIGVSLEWERDRCGWTDGGRSNRS